MYNLVTRQDSQTNLSVARDMMNDSAAMKTNAAVIMSFLPATAVSRFFGMAFFNRQGGVLTVTYDWWLFVATTVPTTAILFLIWLSYKDSFHAVEIAGKLTTGAWRGAKVKVVVTELPSKPAKRPSSLKMLLSLSST